MLVLGIDFETTGLSPAEDRIIEIGAVLWDWELVMPMQVLSCFVGTDRPLSEETVRLTGITQEILNHYGRDEVPAIYDLCALVEDADYCMAHYGNNFDKPFLEATVRRLEFDMPDKLWLDTSLDIRYPESMTTRNLRHLASEHSFLNPFSHRAVFDVLTMLKVASNYSLEEIIARANEPTVYVKALVTFEEKEFAKARGYRWCAPRKIWWRSWKQSDYEADRFECGFLTELLAEAPE